MLPLFRRHDITALIIGMALMHSLVAHAASYNNQTLTGTVLLPALPFPQTHSFLNTITLNSATVELEGYLRNEQNPVIVQGNGLINIRGPEGIWTNGWTYSHLTIGSGVEVNAYSGARFYSDGVNQGTIAATPGGNGGVYGNKFSVGLDQFTNEGLIEARAGSTIEMYLMDALFENDGTIRVHPTATLDLAIEQGFPMTPANLGVVENNGLVKLNQFRMTGHGVFELRGAGTWDFQRYTEIVNSTLTIPATATARIVSTSNPSVRFSDVKINGVMNSAASSDVTIDGGLQLNGQWRTASNSELFFHGSQTVSGVGQFIADGGTTFRTSVGTTTFGPDVDLVVPAGGSLSLNYFNTPPATPYILQGDVQVTGGSFSTSLGTTENHGAIHASSGNVTFGGTLQNHGSITIDGGARLSLSGAFINNGTTTVENGILRLNSFPQGNAISITDSKIEAAVFNQTLAQLQALPRTRSEFMTAAPVYLEGQTLTIADVDNSRWALGTGGFQNGTIDSADGFELAVSNPGSSALLRNLVLNANARVTAGNTLQINANVTGTGDLIVDGGTLQFGGYGNQGEPMTSDAVARAVFEPGAVGNNVRITGPMDNAGRTIYLKAGAAWELDVLRSKGVTGGRIEGDPGVELLINGYGAYPGYGDFNAVTLATHARVGSHVAIDGGLTLDDGVLTIGASNTQNTIGSATFYGNSTLGGVGEVRFFGPPPTTTVPYPRFISTTAQAARLTIAPGVTVRTSDGDGAFFYGNKLPGTLTNEGRLLAENGHTLTLITDDFIQRGTLRATTGATLAVIDTTLINEGRLETAGGQITFTGDLAQASTAAIGIQLLPPPSAPSLPAIQTDGSVALDGALELYLTFGYSPAPGDSFRLIEASGGITGVFDEISLPHLNPGLYWQFDAQPTSLNVAITSGGPPADFDSNGQTDGHDFLAWQRAQSPAGLTPEDLAAWQTNFGASASTTTLTAIPEPRALTLLLPLLALPCSRRLRRR